MFVSLFVIYSISEQPPTVTWVCDGVEHGEGESYIKICVVYDELPLDIGWTTKFYLTQGNSAAAITHVTHTNTFEDCATFTIYSYGTYNWTAEVRGPAGATYVYGTIVVDSANQDCNWNEGHNDGDQ